MGLKSPPYPNKLMTGILIACCVILLAGCTMPPVYSFSASKTLAPTMVDAKPSATIIPTKTSQQIAKSPTPLPSPTLSPTPDFQALERLDAMARSLFSQETGKARLNEEWELPDGTTVETIKEATLVLIPLLPDFFIDAIKELQIIPVPEGFKFQLHSIRDLMIDESYGVKLGIVANTYNPRQTFVAALVMEVYDLSGNRLEYVSISPEQGHLVTFLGTKNEISPNKVENILLALRQLAHHQEKFGVFHKGLEYAYLNLLNMGKGEYFYLYKDSLNKFRAPIRANGICAVATGISSLLYAENPEVPTVLERWRHQDLYHQGPFSSPRLLMDAAIEFGPEDYQRYDLRWVQREDAYLNVNAHLFPTGIKPLEAIADGVTGPSDVGILLSFSFDEELVYSSETFNHLLEQMQGFRSSLHAQPLNKDPKTFSAHYQSLLDPNTMNFSKQVFDIEDLSLFEQVIENDLVLQDILAFGNAINSYSEKGGLFLNEYLKKTDWFHNYLKVFEADESRVGRLIDRVTCRQIVGEPLQCVGFVVLLTELYPSMGFPYVGRASADMAGKIVPDIMFGLEGVFDTNFGESFLVGKSLQIRDYNAGDTFVLKGEPGHVGVVLARIGETLLVADSNRHWNGRVRVFTVNRNNFDDVFGERKYIVLNNQCVNALNSEDLKIDAHQDFALDMFISSDK